MKAGLFAVLGVLVVGGALWFSGTRAPEAITTFDACVAAGNPVREGYPRTCRTEAGELFVEEEEVPPSDPDAGAARETFALAAYNVAFSYPRNTYALVETPQPDSAALHSLALFEREAYEDLLQSSDAREAPPSITLEIFSADQWPSAQAWITESPHSNLRLGSGSTTQTRIGSVPGLAYTWSGLYEGESHVVIRGAYLYQFSVTYLSRQDALMRDFPALLSSVTFEDADRTPSAENSVPWEQAVAYIENCEAAMVMQTHAREVTVELKNGTSITAIEPNIDDVFAIVDRVRDRCGAIPLATE